MCKDKQNQGLPQFSSVKNAHFFINKIINRVNLLIISTYTYHFNYLE